MNKYEKRISKNPDQYSLIELADIVYMDFIRTTYPTGSSVAEYWQQGKPAPIPPVKIPVAITEISGEGYLGGDFLQFYAKELADISITVSIDKPDGTQLVLPMMREDTGRVVYKFGTVLGGETVFTFAFPTSGKWESTEALINTQAQGDDAFSFAGVSAIVDL
tara:strand:+ start:6861 stop:7349 length:489 start_codon:yes stop_codon:yes gene_type:complete